LEAQKTRNRQKTLYVHVRMDNNGFLTVCELIGDGKKISHAAIRQRMFAFAVHNSNWTAIRNDSRAINTILETRKQNKTKRTQKLTTRHYNSNKKKGTNKKSNNRKHNLAMCSQAAAAADKHYGVI